MDFTSIDTTENPKQLSGDFLSAVRRHAHSIKDYIRKKNFEKIKPQLEVFKYFFIMETLLKQLAAKMVNHSRAIATDLSNQADKNPDVSLQNLSNLDRSLSELEKHISRQIQMANVLRRMARQSRTVVRGTYDSTARRIAEMRRREQRIPTEGLRQISNKQRKKEESKKKKQDRASGKLSKLIPGFRT